MEGRVVEGMVGMEGGVVVVGGVGGTRVVVGGGVVVVEFPPLPVEEK